MFGIPGKSPVTLTPRAVSQIARLMARDGAFGLKLADLHVLAADNKKQTIWVLPASLAFVGAALFWVFRR